MSSDEDEFFDAPDAFPCSTTARKWSDQDDEALSSALDFEQKNARRRSKVESLKKNYVEQACHPHFPGSLYSRNGAAGLFRSSLRETDHEFDGLENLESQFSRSGLQPNADFIPYYHSISTPGPENPRQIYPTANRGHIQYPGVLSSYEATQSTLDPTFDPYFSRSSLKSSFRPRLSENRIVPRGKTRTVPATSQVESLDPTRLSATIATFCDQNELASLNYFMTTHANQLDRTDDSNACGDLLFPSAVLNEEYLVQKLPTPGNLGVKTAVDSMVQTSDTLLASSTPYQEQVSTLQAVERTQNPIELRFRTLTEGHSMTGLDHEKTATESRLAQHSNTASTARISRFQKYLRDAVSAVKSVTKAKNEEPSDEDEEVIGSQGIRLRSSRQARGHREFVQIKLIQEMKNEHTGAVWAMRFSPCGRLLATAGYDRNIRIWVLRQWYTYFKRMQQSSASPAAHDEFDPSGFASGAFSNLVDEENLIDSVSLTSNSASTTGRTDDGASTCSSLQAYTTTQSEHTSAAVVVRRPPDLERGRRTVFRSQPLLVYRGHEGVVTDVAWSKNLFLLATSMDHQVRLWHISRRDCLCSFNHNDTVPTIVFHPKDDRYFLSGSLDGKLRLWNIPDKKVRFWVEVPLPSALPVPSCSGTNLTGSGGFTVSSLFKSSTPMATPQASSVSGGVARHYGPKTIITCATFACDGTKVVVGTYDGRVMFFNSELSYITFITIRSGGTSRARQTRITAIELDPTDSNKILVTSNDSRLRLIDARDYHVLCKYRGFVNQTSQIRASFSPTGRYLISGSENALFYIWRKSLDIDRISRFSRSRKDRNNCWEAIKAHDTMVTVAVFSPNPNLVLDKSLRHSQFQSERHSRDPKPLTFQTLGLDDLPKSADPRYPTPYFGELVVSADCNGCIRVFKKQNTEPMLSATS